MARRSNATDLAGKIVVLDIWAAWCAPCLPELGRLGRLRAEFDPDQVVVLAVAVDSTEAAVRRVAALHEHLPIIALGDRSFEEAFGPLWGLPKTVILDREWRLRGEWAGAVTDKSAQLRARVLELLAEGSD